MSEEKSEFKVTDRRLFNSDGTPRDIVREDRPVEPPLTTATTTTTQPAPETSTPNAPPAASHKTDAASASATSATTDATASDNLTESDPLFIELMMFVAENAAAMLSGHPQFGGEVNLPYAKGFIDMLGALKHKTLGKLSFEEESTLDTLLAQLRMQYVALNKAPRPTSPLAGGGGGGFTGGDITGGR